MFDLLVSDVQRSGRALKGDPEKKLRDIRRDYRAGKQDAEKITSETAGWKICNLWY